MVDVDDDLAGMSGERLVAETKLLKAAIRAHRDSSGHDLCWYHPQLWALLPDRVDPKIAVPPWDKFMHGCVRYRRSLDIQAPNAAAHDQDYEE
jgi:hypothetical protein